jgi:ATP-dependent Clp protease, protease subunit
MLKTITVGQNIKSDALQVEPTIIKVTEFSEKGYSGFCEAFQKAVDSKQAIIPINIDSYGGQVYSLLGMLELIRTSPVPVATYVATKAMSCGAVLFSAGTEGFRFMAPNATILVHQVSGAAWGKVEDIEVSAKHTVALNKQLMGILSTNCGHKANYFSKQLLANGNADLYYNARQSVDHNLANHIKTPVFKVELKQKVTLE